MSSTKQLATIILDTEPELETGTSEEKSTADKCRQLYDKCDIVLEKIKKTNKNKVGKK